MDAGLTWYDESEDLRRLSVVVAGLEHLDVGVGDLGLLAKLFLDALNFAIDLAVVHPEHEAEREEVLAARDLLGRQPTVGERGRGQLGDVDLVQAVLLQRSVVDGVGGIAGHLHVLGSERAGVHDQRAFCAQIAQVGLQRGRVHRHQHIGLIARRVDLAAGEVELESRNSRQRAGRSANLGGIVLAASRGSLPASAVARVNSVPVSCMPSPGVAAKANSRRCRSSSIGRTGGGDAGEVSMSILESAPFLGELVAELPGLRQRILGCRSGPSPA